jgi:hypothetical protein
MNAVVQSITIYIAGGSKIKKIKKIYAGVKRAAAIFLKLRKQNHNKPPVRFVSSGNQRQIRPW